MSNSMMFPRFHNALPGMVAIPLLMSSCSTPGNKRS